MTKPTPCIQCHESIQGPAIVWRKNHKKGLRHPYCATFGRLREKVEKLRLPVPNPYGTTVKVTKYNEIIDKILKLIEEEI